MLLLIRIFPARTFISPGIFTADNVPAHVARPFSADSVLRDVAPTAVNVPALTEHARAIFIFKFHRVMIENLAVVRTFADLATAHAVRAHWMAFLDPVCHVDVMDMLLDDMIAAEPNEIIPIAHLVFHLGEFAPSLLFEV